MSSNYDGDNESDEVRRVSVEHQIRNDFTDWYRSNRNSDTVFIEEYRTTENTLVDLAGSEWKQGSEYEVKIWAAECKKKLTARGFYGYLEQLRGYGKYFPELSLLVKSATNPEALRTIGEAMRVGIYLVDSASEVTEISKPRTRLFDEEACMRTKTVATMQLIFSQVVSNATLNYSSWGVYTGTKDQVQYNSYIDDNSSTCRIGVNVENVVRSDVLSRMNSNLQPILMQLPKETCIRLWRVFRFAKDRRSLIVTSCGPQDFEVERIKRLIEEHMRERTTGHDLTIDQRQPNRSDTIQSFHFELSLPIWKKYEVLSREQCLDRMRSAKDALQPIFDHLSSNS